MSPPPPPLTEPCNVAGLRKEGETDSQQLHWQLQDVGGGRRVRGTEEGRRNFPFVRSRALGGNWELLAEAAPFF